MFQIKKKKDVGMVVTILKTKYPQEQHQTYVIAVTMTSVIDNIYYYRLGIVLEGILFLKFVEDF